MSAIGSSVINKSAKKIAPRAAVQRRQLAVSASPQSSARASVDRQGPPAVTTRDRTGSVTVDAVPSRENHNVHGEGRDTSSASQALPQALGSSEKEPAAVATPNQVEPLQETPVNLPSSSALPVGRRPSEPVSTLSSTPLPVNSPPHVSHETRHIPARRRASAAEDGEVDHATASEPPSKRRRVKPSESEAVTGRQTRQSNAPGADSIPSTNQAARAINPADDVTEVGTTGTSRAKSKGLATPKGKEKEKAQPKTRATAQSKATPKAKTAKKASTTKPRRSKRKASEPESEVDEEFEIVPSQVTMADLCEDTGKGKRSNREKRIAELEKLKAEQRQKARKTKPTQGVEAVERPTEGGAGLTTENHARDDLLEAPPRQRTRAAPGLRWVNGKMVVDDQSLQVDRHADAAMEVDELEEVEENDLTRRVTQHVWQKNKKKARWNEATTERFYAGLRMFGTDFLTISKMFPGFTRHQIKLKFTREEKLDADRIRDSLMGPKDPMDLSVLTCNEGVEYEDPAEFQKQLDREAAEFAENQKRQKEEAQELMRQNRANNATAAAAGNNAENDNAAGNSNAAEQGNQGATKKGTQTKKGAKQSTKKPKKKMHSRFGGGEEVEVVGSID